MYASEGMPKLIPKIIHQTYKSMRVPEAMKPFMACLASEEPGLGDSVL